LKDLSNYDAETLLLKDTMILYRMAYEASTYRNWVRRVYFWNQL